MKQVIEMIKQNIQLKRYVKRFLMPWFIVIIVFIRKMYQYVLKCTVTVWKLRIVVDYMEKFLLMLLEKCIRKREMLYPRHLKQSSCVNVSGTYYSPY